MQNLTITRETLLSEKAFLNITRSVKTPDPKGNRGEGRPWYFSVFILHIPHNSHRRPDEQLKTKPLMRGKLLQRRLFSSLFIWCCLQKNKTDNLFLNVTDIDECSSPESNNCSVNALCTNTEGFYVCRCLKGFEGDGLICRGD